MKKFFTSKIVITLFALAIVVGAWTTWYVFFKPHRNIATEKAAYTLSADQLLKEFNDNNATATTKYIDKAVLIDGTVSEVVDNTVSFNTVACTVDSSQVNTLSAIKVGDKIKLQGQVVGFNELLGEVTLSKCYFK